MTTLRLTAIMKTDISDSTLRFRTMRESDLAVFLAEHRAFVSRLTAKHQGRIVKSEGDAFWAAFPSVTAAGLAAIALQEELRRSQANKGDDRLAMRIVITLGDVLHEDADFFGDAVNLAARIEAVTPPDEIYLSAAARLAVNQAEIRTALVDAFVLKGFPEPVPVYRIEALRRTQTLTDQYIVWTDLRGFGRFLADTGQITNVERILDTLLQLVNMVCHEFGGANRFSSADAHCLTFSDPDRALTATQRLVEEWDGFDRREQLNCSIAAAVHKGSLNLFQSYAYGLDLNIVAGLVEADRSQPGSSILVTDCVQKELIATQWQARLQAVDIGLGKRNQLSGVGVYRLILASPDPP